MPSGPEYDAFLPQKITQPADRFLVFYISFVWCFLEKETDRSNVNLRHGDNSTVMAGLILYCKPTYGFVPSSACPS